MPPSPHAARAAISFREIGLMPMDDLPPGASPLLEVKDLKTHFLTQEGVVHAVDGLDLVIHRGEILALVGESGCGKTVAALSILRLVEPPGKIVHGRIRFDGHSLLDLPERQMDDLRGRRISMVFQQPLSCLNPVFTIGDQLAEVLEIHHGMPWGQAREQAGALFHQVGIADADHRAGSYPHEISGGQAQRVMIAMALALNPELLIADEPTAALDTTIQSQIIELLRQMVRERGTAMMLITHDLGLAAETADRVAVMYAGHIIEQAEAAVLFERPLHPYTQGLIASVPVPGEVRVRLETIPGSVPDPVDPPPGCRFAPRCTARVRYGLEICTRREPALEQVAAGRWVRCWLYTDQDAHKAPLRA